jgi:hypothetical protein
VRCYSLYSVKYLISDQLDGPTFSGSVAVASKVSLDLRWGFLFCFCLFLFWVCYCLGVLFRDRSGFKQTRLVVESVHVIRQEPRGKTTERGRGKAHVFEGRRPAGAGNEGGKEEGALNGLNPVLPRQGRFTANQVLSRETNKERDHRQAWPLPSPHIAAHTHSPRFLLT